MAARKTKSEELETESAAPIWRWSIALGFSVVWLLLALSLLSYSPADPPGHTVVPVNDPPSNWIGPVGAFLAHWTYLLLGAGAWALLAGTGVWLGLAITRRTVTQPTLRVVGVVLLALAVSGFQFLLAPNSGSSPQGAGGLVAIAGVSELTARFSTLGSALWLLLLAGVGAIVAFDQWIFIIPNRIWRATSPAMRAAASKSRESLAAKLEARAEAKRVRQTDLDDDDRLNEVAEPDTTARVNAAAATKKKKKTKPEPEEIEDDEYEYEYEDDEWEYEDEEDDASEPVAEADEAVEEDDDDAPGAPQVFNAEAARQKIAGLPVRFASATRSESSEDHLRDIQNTVDLENYKFPGLDLLEEPEESYSDEMEQFVREQAEALEEALKVYRIDGEVVGIDSGPVITLYEVRLAPGTKVSRLTAVSSDIARALKAINIRIVANMAGRDTVGVEVPNAKKEKVRLKELMTCAEGAERVKKMMLPMFLGKDASGEPLIEDLAAMPHTLIAGTTGSGKSVCLNTIIMSFLFTKKPNELKLVLIDPKMVELSMFRDIPHLMCPVVTEMSKAAAILEWAVTKMDERYELLAEAGVRDIASYNDLEEEELLDRMQPSNEREAASIPRKLPYIVFIIDELADLMMTHKEVEGAIVRIAQKARAVGIHLVLATQRPQANVVTGLIKSNMPARMTFKVASGMDSRIVLDQKGGELLLGQGDMLFLSPRSHKLMRSQGTLVDDREARRVVRFLRDVAAPSFERQLVQLKSPGEAAGAEAESRGIQSALEDPLFEKAVDIVLETKRGSVSLLQRRLAIGYTRASRLIDLMGEVGVIGAYKGTVAREVVVSPEQWEDMRAQLRALANGDEPDLFTADDDKSGDAIIETMGVPTGASLGNQAIDDDDDAPGEDTTAAPQATAVATSEVVDDAPAPEVTIETVVNAPIAAPAAPNEEITTSESTPESSNDEDEIEDEDDDEYEYEDEGDEDESEDVDDEDELDDDEAGDEDEDVADDESDEEVEEGDEDEEDDGEDEYEYEYEYVEEDDDADDEGEDEDEDSEGDEEEEWDDEEEWVEGDEEEEEDEDEEEDDPLSVSSDDDADETVPDIKTAPFEANKPAKRS